MSTKNSTPLRRSSRKIITDKENADPQRTPTAAAAVNYDQRSPPKSRRLLNSAAKNRQNLGLSAANHAAETETETTIRHPVIEINLLSDEQVLKHSLVGGTPSKLVARQFSRLSIDNNGNGDSKNNRKKPSQASSSLSELRHRRQNRYERDLTSGSSYSDSISADEDDFVPARTTKPLLLPQTRRKSTRNEAIKTLDAAEATPKLLATRSSSQRSKAVAPKLVTGSLAVEQLGTPKSLTPGGKHNQLKKKVTTPKSSRRLKTTTKSSGGQNRLEILARQLHSSVLPENLECREEQIEAVADFVVDNLLEKRSKSLYVSGVPGTGKTATVHKVIQTLQKAPDCPKFKFVEINGMKIGEAKEFYSQLYGILKQADKTDGKKCPPNQALQYLNQLFEHATEPTVLLVDEMDQLCTGRQGVLYQVFEWATRDAARLIVIAIANTLDLPERLLTHRVSSRLGMERESFQPYDHKQVEQILTTRLSLRPDDALEEEDAVEQTAIALISRKVAAVSGDLRKALHICRQAIDAAIINGEKTLTSQKVQSVMAEMRESVRMEWLRGLPVHAQLFMEAIVLEYERSGHEQLAIPAVYCQYRDLATLQYSTYLTEEPILRIVSSLVYSGILDRAASSAQSRLIWNAKVSLNLPAEDVKFALSK